MSVPVIREDLRQLLVAASLYADELRDQGKEVRRLQQAIDRIGATGTVHDWQPNPRRDDE